MRRVYLIVTLLIGGAASQSVPDECSESRCGDQCLSYGDNCHCGNDIFPLFPVVDQQFCCISSDDTCSLSLVDNGYEDSAGQPLFGNEGFCGGGKVQPMSMPCNNTERRLQCHNSYQDSREIGLGAHYTCPHACVSVRQEMCRGVNWCGEYQECHEDLRCYRTGKRILN